MSQIKCVAIKRTDEERVLLPKARWCASFLCKLRGLTFRRRISEQDALILVETADSVASSAIHMMFVFSPIAAIWINSAGRVVDCQLAKPFRLLYRAAAPAQYVLEGPPAFLDLFHPGDRIAFEPLPG